MAISNEILRLQNAKAALKTAINAKNDSSHQIDDETLEDYAGFVNLIHDALPAAYTELEYIESSGTQYIDTNYYPNSDDLFEMKIRFNADTAQQRVFCSRINDGKKKIFEVYVNGSKQFACNITTESETNRAFSPAVAVATGVDYVLNRTGNFTYSLNGTSYSVSSYTYLEGEDYTEPLHLFGGSYIVSLGGKNFNGRFYYFKVPNKIHLVPAKRNSDNAIGMYDKVSGTFLTNAGTGEFIIPAGAKVLPLGYKELEYIESSGTQFIDTGIPLKTATDDVEVDFYLGSLVTTSSIFGARYSTTSRAYSFGVTNENQWRPSFGSTTENTGTATTGRHVAFMSHNGGTLTVDGTQIISIGNATITTPDECYVFAIKGNAKIYYSSCRIYSFKIWRSDVLLMHLVPAQRMSDFEAGMYDKVSDTFFTNSGTGKFIVPSGQGVRLITKGISSNGTYNASDDGADGYSQVSVVAQVQEAEANDVNFYDYDGKILYSYSASEFAQLTALPANPSHPGLTSQGWNWNLADAKAQVTAVGVCDIGQMYVTDDGKTRLYCHFEDAVKHFYFGLGVNGTLLIDWGDGTTSTMTGSNRGSVTRTEHTYATGGDYVITITVSSGNFAFYGTSNYGYLFSKSDVNASNIHYPNLACLKRVELGSDVYFGNYSFCRCSNLETITIPSDMPSSVGTCVFYYCYSLKHITIPTKTSSPITSLTNSMFYYAYSLQSISVPKTITTIGNSLLYNACALKRFVMPSTITSVGTNLLYANYSINKVYISTSLTGIMTTDFYKCYSLCSLVVPASVTSIATKAFQDCYGMREYHFKNTTPPTLDNADAFTNIQSDCVIYVPSASLTAYQGATNWSTYASQMVGE